MAKIKTSDQPRFGKKFTYSVGTISFDKDGITEVSDDVVEKLLSLDSRLSLLEMGDNGNDDKNKKDNEGDGNKLTPQLEEKKKELETLTVKDLKEIALGIEGVDKDAINKMVKKDLVNFLLEKI